MYLAAHPLVHRSCAADPGDIDICDRTTDALRVNKAAIDPIEPDHPADPGEPAQPDDAPHPAPEPKHVPGDPA